MASTTPGRTAMSGAEPAPEPSGGVFGRSPLILPGDVKPAGTGVATTTAANANLRTAPILPLASRLGREFGKRLISRRGLLVLLPAFLALPLSIAIALMLPSASKPPVRTAEINIEQLTPPQRHAELGIEPVQPVTSAKPRLSARTHAVPSSRRNPGPQAPLPCLRRSC
jgi:hypothetical protein